MTDLVVESLEAWDSVWRRNQHLVAGLLRSDPSLRVLFVEPAADPLHAVSRRARPRVGRGLRPGPPVSGVAAGRLWLHQPTKPLPRRWDRRADERRAASTVRAAARAGLTAPHLWINAPDAAAVLARTGWPALYDVTDDWLEADRTPQERARLVRDERLLLDRCEEVVVCSPRLVASKGASRPVTLIPNAVDVAAYQVVRPRPTDLPAGRVAVYVGTVHGDRMDLPLCASTARAVAGLGSLVLVGPAPLGATERRGLVDAGVLLLGARGHDDVPGYLQHADVLVVPHLVNAFTDSLDPIKVYEYRAAGRPVVSTPVAGFRESGDPRVVLAPAAEFPEAVRAELSRPRGPALIGDAPDWTTRVDQMRAVLDRLR